MKKIIKFIFPLLLVSSLVGCSNETKYFSKHLSFTQLEKFYLYDEFDISKFDFFYEEEPLDEKQIVVNYSNFDSSKVGDVSIKVSLALDENAYINIPISIEKRNVANILSIGTINSFDISKYSPIIGKESMEDFSYNIYALVGSDEFDINDHINNFYEDKEVYNLYSYDFEEMKWEIDENQSITQALSLKGVKFDFLCLEGNGFKTATESGNDELSSFINATSSYLKQVNKKTPLYVLNEVWAYQDDVTIDNYYFENFDNSQKAMHEALNENYLKIDCVDLKIANNTLIQSLRESSLEDSLDFTRDGRHLENNVASYLTSLNFLIAISGYTLEDFTYIGEIITQEEKDVLSTLI